MVTLCWECDGVVRPNRMGWYTCARCGFESLRAVSCCVEEAEERARASDDNDDKQLVLALLSTKDKEGARC